MCSEWPTGGGWPIRHGAAGFEVVMDMSREQMGHLKCQWATTHPDVGRSTGNSSGMECAEGDMLQKSPVVMVIEQTCITAAQQAAHTICTVYGYTIGRYSTCKLI